MPAFKINYFCRLLKIKPRNKKGLNLMEVALAIALLALMTVSLLNVFNQGYRFLRRNRITQSAYFLAQEKMEELLTQAVFPDPATHNESRQDVVNFTDFQRQVNFTCPPPGFDSTYANLTLVNVTVYWQGQRGEQNFSLLGMVANLSH